MRSSRSPHDPDGARALLRRAGWRDTDDDDGVADRDVALARTLEPRYLVCDEPTSMLDVSTQAALLAAVAHVQEQRELGVLLITHGRALARHWCERVVALPGQQGR